MRSDIRRDICKLLVFTVTCLLLVVGNSYAVFDFDEASGIVLKANGWLFSQVKGIVSVGLFLVAVWLYIDGYFTETLQRKWFAIVGILVFIACINIINWLYRLLAGFDNNVYDGSSLPGL